VTSAPVRDQVADHFLAPENAAFPVVHAIGGTSAEAHRAGLDRVMHADRLLKEQ
jgi:hypothetical protein